MNDSLSEEMAARFAPARGVADALLYEGYVLYPYHASNPKNAGGARFQWGVLTPRRWADADRSERSVMRTELIVGPGAEPVLAVRIRCLQIQHRAVEAAEGEGGFIRTVKLEVGDRLWMEWDEALERDVELGVIPLLPAAGATRAISFRFPGAACTEIITDGDAPAGRIIRSTAAVDGVARVRAAPADGPGELIKVTIEVENVTDWCEPGAPRDEVIRHSLVAVHTMAALQDAAFCSALDPPAGTESAVAGCMNRGAYPVLVGKTGATDLVLASPIILSDYPTIAPESEGDFHDGLEIDEILALRVLTLTDGEKAQARATDPRAAAIIDRCDNMAAQSWDRLHGTMRDMPAVEGDGGRIDMTDPKAGPWLDPVIDGSFDPWTDTVLIGADEVGKGSRVRLHPSHRADVQDMFLADLTATVAGVFHDVDGGSHIAVTIDKDPAARLYERQGRFFYFHPDELEPLTEAGT